MIVSQSLKARGSTGELAAQALQLTSDTNLEINRDS